MHDIEDIKSVLNEIGFPEKNQTYLTAIAVMALSDQRERDGLLTGKTCLADGARITDIIEFAKTDLDREYAENTRETIRKHSLKYLVDFGLAQVNADDPKRAVNSGRTNYTLVSEFRELLKAYGEERPLFNKMKKDFVNEAVVNRKKYLESLRHLDVQVQVPFTSQVLSLSPGEHNIIEKVIVDELFVGDGKRVELVYLGDTRDKTKFQNVELLKILNISVDEHAKLPDVVGFNSANQEVFIFEAVASSGPVDALRKKELEALFASCPYNINMATVFLKPSLYQKFATTIAPGTLAYVLETKLKIQYSDI